jgi:hypothetical protein
MTSRGIAFPSKGASKERAFEVGNDEDQKRQGK